jgi:hypothetical protein
MNEESYDETTMNESALSDRPVVVLECEDHRRE